MLCVLYDESSPAFRLRRRGDVLLCFPVRLWRIGTGVLVSFGVIWYRLVSFYIPVRLRRIGTGVMFFGGFVVTAGVLQQIDVANKLRTPLLPDRFVRKIYYNKYTLFN